MAANVTLQITSTNHTATNHKSNVIDLISSEDTDGDEPAVPDSTTSSLEKERVEFNHGEDALLKHKDGRYYLGTVVEIDYIRDQCLLRFGDNTESWALTKELTKLSLPDEDLLCVICKKSSPKEKNDIIVCDKCGRGYHLVCHQPIVSPQYKNNCNYWHCKKCVEYHQSQNAVRRVRDSVTNDTNRTRRVKDSIRKICSGPDEVNKSLPVDRSKLPYNPDLLNWDTYHRVNMEQIYCYCGRNGEWYTQMLQCGRCKQWFHEKCVKCLRYPLYCGDRFYIFVCSICNYGTEFLRRLEMKWVDMVHLMLFNLTAFNAKKYYDLDTVIVPYINDNWHALQLPPKINNVSKSERRENILSVLTNNRNRFKCGREIKKRTTIWGLRVRLPPPAPCVTLPSIGPISETELKDRWHGNKRLQFLPLNTNTSSDSNVSSATKSSHPEMVVPVDPEMVNLMMGMAYHDSNVKSETDSPCPSPEIDVDKKQLNASIKLTQMHKAAVKSSIGYFDSNDIKSESDSPCTSPLTVKSEYDGTGGMQQLTREFSVKIEPIVSALSINNDFRSLKSSAFEGAGFVKRSVPFPQKKINKRRKRLLNVTSARDNRILRRHKLLRKLTRTKESGDCSDSSKTTSNTSKKSRILRNSCTNTASILIKNQTDQEHLPPTPPTSVSAPPTPQSTTSTNLQCQSTISEASSDSTEQLSTNFRSFRDSDEKILRSNSNGAGFSDIPTVSNELNTPCDTSGDETSSKSTLDLIIPPPKDFEGKNNPFHNLSKDNASTPMIKKQSIKGVSLPLSLTPVMPLIRTLKRQLSEKDICIGPNGEVKRRRHRRTRSALLHAQVAVSKNATVLPPRTVESHRQLRSTVQPIPNCMDYALNGRRLRQRQDKTNDSNTNQTTTTGKSIIPTISPNNSPVKNGEANINMEDLKSSVNIYFGAANRIASGEKFSIKACRINSDGKVQYLIEWEGHDQMVA